VITAGCQPITSTPEQDLADSPNQTKSDLLLVVGNLDCSLYPNPIESSQIATHFEIRGNQFYLNDEPFFLRGVGFELFAPGESPGTNNGVPDSLPFHCLLKQAKTMGVNTVHISIGDVSQLTQPLLEAVRANELNLSVGIWFNGEANNYQEAHWDFQAPAFRNHVKHHIEAVVDAFHIKFDQDYSDLILYFELGNELSAQAINITNTTHPDWPEFTGEFFTVAAGANATESFLAEMANHIKVYEQAHYGTQHYISHKTWPVVSPALLDTRVLDFISYNLYSYWPDFVSLHPPSVLTGTSYLGALEELASKSTDKPFIVSEFGLSTAPASLMDNTGDECQQALEITDRWIDINNSPSNVMGGVMFELVDQWQKNDYLHTTDGASQYSHDETDSEEWFGLIEMNGSLAVTTFRIKPVMPIVQCYFLNQNRDNCTQAILQKVCGNSDVM
jgi:hypothetical protein